MGASSTPSVPIMAWWPWSIHPASATYTRNGSTVRFLPLPLTSDLASSRPGALVVSGARQQPEVPVQAVVEKKKSSMSPRLPVH